MAISPGDLKPRPPASAPRLSEKERQARAKTAAETITRMADSAAIAVVGSPECHMTDLERESIEDPLARVLERAEPQVLEGLATWTDPLALALALFAWLGRVVQIAQAEQLRREAEQLTEQTRAEQIHVPVEREPEAAAPGETPTFEVVAPDPHLVRQAMGGGDIGGPATWIPKG